MTHSFLEKLKAGMGVEKGEEKVEEGAEKKLKKQKNIYI